MRRPKKTPKVLTGPDRARLDRPPTTRRRERLLGVGWRGRRPLKESDENWLITAFWVFLFLAYALLMVFRYA